METARPAHSVEADAKTLRIGEKTVQRARRALNIPVWKDGYPGIGTEGPPERGGNQVDKLQ
jgi:hypothetical protein